MGAHAAEPTVNYDALLKLAAINREQSVRAGLPAIMDNYALIADFYEQMAQRLQAAEKGGPTPAPVGAGRPEVLLDAS
jgi:hypothetical protein